MQKYRIRGHLGAIVATTLAAALLAGSAYAYAVYHGITHVTAPATVQWTKENFGVSAGVGAPQGTPATLSFMTFADDAAATAATGTPPEEPNGIYQASCLVKVVLPDVGDAPAVGATANVGVAGTPGNPNDAPQPFPWTIGFDDNPAGHWSIDKASLVIGAASNAAASRVAAAGLNALAVDPLPEDQNRQVFVIDGTLAGCQP